MLYFGIFENSWGNLGTQLTSDLYGQNKIFICGICSELVENTKIYHNIIGGHRHLNSIDIELRKEIENKIKEFNNEEVA